MTIQIEEELVDFYLREFTVHWFEEHDDAPDDLNEYNDLIEGVRRHLADENETEPFRQALTYLIFADSTEISRFDGGSGFTAGELRALFQHIYRQIWGEITNSAVHVKWV